MQNNDKASKYPVAKSYQVTSDTYRTEIDGEPFEKLNEWIEPVGSIKRFIALDSHQQQHRLMVSFARLQNKGYVLPWVKKYGLPALASDLYGLDGFPKDESKNRLDGIAEAAGSLRELRKILSAVMTGSYARLEKLSEVAIDRRQPGEIFVCFPRVPSAYYCWADGLSGEGLLRWYYPEAEWKQNPQGCVVGAAWRCLIQAANIMLKGVQPELGLYWNKTEWELTTELKPRCPWHAIAIRFAEQVSTLPLRVCEICSASLKGKPPQTKTCSPKCRQTLSRKNRNN